MYDGAATHLDPWECRREPTRSRAEDQTEAKRDDPMRVIAEQIIACNAPMSFSRTYSSRESRARRIRSRKGRATIGSHADRPDGSKSTVLTILIGK